MRELGMTLGGFLLDEGGEVVKTGTRRTLRGAL